MGQSIEGFTLIIGQGIAGTTLALHLEQAGLSYHIVDRGHRGSSSIGAAGLYNPLILKRRKLTWRAGPHLDYAMPWYRQQQTLWQGDYIHETGILRRMADSAEYNEWEMIAGDDTLAPYVGKALPATASSSLIDAPHGYREVLQAGYIDVKDYLARARGHFIERQALTVSDFESDRLIKLGGEWHYAGKHYARIVFCTGYQLGASKQYFPDLALNPAKGHTLMIYAPELQSSQVVQGPCFIIPQGDDLYKIGSTYSWHQLDGEIESAEVKKLQGMYERFCSAPYEIVEAWAGVRPATKDRKPLIGVSLIDPDAYIFGGMGSRAIMNAPWLAHRFLAYLGNTDQLLSEVDIARLYR